MAPIRVLLVDDHALFRKGIAAVLATREGIDVVGEAADGVEALDKARELAPDIVLMDIGMPRSNGMEAMSLIKKELPSVKIVMLTISNDDKDLIEAVKRGAQGYLLKDLEPSDFFVMLEGAARGEAAVSRSMSTRIMTEFRRQRATESIARAQSHALTAREKEVLGLVAKGATNKEIAATLTIAENTVKNHLRKILDKLHLENRVQAAAFALRADLAEVGSLVELGD